MNPLRSAVPEIRWPSLPTPNGASLLALEYQFRFSEVSSHESRLASQWRQLARLTQHARETVPFYRHRLGCLDNVEAMRPDWGAWVKVPVLSHNELSSLGIDLHSTAVPAEHGKVQIMLVPVANGDVVDLLKDTELNQHFARAIVVREHLWHERNFRAKHAIIDASPKTKTLHGIAVAGWDAALDAAFECVAAQALHIDIPAMQQVKWLKAIKPEILTTTPINAAALAEYCLTNTIKLPSLREIRAVGGVLPDLLRQHCQDIWNASVSHTFSVGHVGAVALQCPVSGLLHVQAEHVLVEIVDEGGWHCRPGEVGRLVVTCLHNFAAPLLRYDTGHRAEVGESCACGRTLPILRCF